MAVTRSRAPIYGAESTLKGSRNVRAVYARARKKDFSDVSGLPDELGIDENLGRAEQHLTIRTEERTCGEAVTILKRFDKSSVEVGDSASTLESQLATGGTVEEGRVELRGDRGERAAELLRDEGFQVGG